MGTIYHETIVATSGDETCIKRARDIAIEIFSARLVSEIIASPVNHYFSFMISTSGSKLGWTDYEDHVANTKTFGERMKDAAIGYGYIDWVAVRYGADWDYAPKAIASNASLDDGDELPF